VDPRCAGDYLRRIANRAARPSVNTPARPGPRMPSPLAPSTARLSELASKELTVTAVGLHGSRITLVPPGPVPDVLLPKEKTRVASGFFDGWRRKRSILADGEDAVGSGGGAGQAVVGGCFQGGPRVPRA